MVDAWLVRGYQLPYELATLWAEANRRVLGSRRLREYLDIIMDDAWGSDEDHLRWVARGRVGEIEAWAKGIRKDIENAAD